MVDAKIPEQQPAEAEFNLAEWVNQNPNLADEIFGYIDRAAQSLLPGSHFHERYENVSGIGLALAITADNEDTVNPVQDPEVVRGSMFIADNKDRYPKAWEWKDSDAKTLGVEKIPAETLELGRFVTVAAAKIVHLAKSPDSLSSFEKAGPEVAQGEVAFAGGRRQSKSLGSISGLWEIHDHITMAVFGLAAKSISEETSPSNPYLRYFAIANMLQEEFDNVQDILDEMDKTATELSRDELDWLVHEIDTSYLEKVQEAVA